MWIFFIKTHDVVHIFHLFVHFGDYPVHVGLAYAMPIDLLLSQVLDLKTICFIWEEYVELVSDPDVVTETTRELPFLKLFLDARSIPLSFLDLKFLELEICGCHGFFSFEE